MEVSGQAILLPCPPICIFMVHNSVLCQYAINDKNESETPSKHENTIYCKTVLKPVRNWIISKSWLQLYSSHVTRWNLVPWNIILGKPHLLSVMQEFSMTGKIFSSAYIIRAYNHQFRKEAEVTHFKCILQFWSIHLNTKSHVSQLKDYYQAFRNLALDLLIFIRDR